MDRNQKNRVLITGSAGYLGRHVYEVLRRGSWSPVGLRHEHTAPKQRTVPGNILKPASLDRVMKGIDSVVHCAAVMGTDLPAGHYAVNSDGTRNVLGAASRAGVRRFVYISSLAVMDEYIDHDGDDESAPYPARFRDLYAASKAEAETAVLAGKDSMEVIILRPGWIWGPGDPGTHRLFQMLSDGRFFFIGDGQNLTYLTYIDNMVEAVKLALTAHDIPSGEIFIITDGSRVSMKQFIDTVSWITGSPPVSRHVPQWIAMPSAFFFEKIRPGDGISRQNVSILSRNLHFSIGKARKELGYRPDTDLEAHVRAVVKHGPGLAGAQE